MDNIKTPKAPEAPKAPKPTGNTLHDPSTGKFNPSKSNSSGLMDKLGFGPKKAASPTTPVSPSGGNTWHDPNSGRFAMPSNNQKVRDLGFKPAGSDGYMVNEARTAEDNMNKVFSDFNKQYPDHHKVNAEQSNKWWNEGGFQKRFDDADAELDRIYTRQWNKANPNMKFNKETNKYETVDPSKRIWNEDLGEYEDIPFKK